MNRPGLGAAAVLVAVAVLFLAGLGARDLWNPNEPAYGPAAAEMVRSDAWMVPTLNGRTFADKPILYYWAARAASAVLGGPHELALRLPGAIAALATAWMLYVLILPYAGRRTALLAPLLFATLFVLWWSARQIQMDIFVTASTLGVLLPVTRVLDHGLPARTGWLWAGVAAGLGLLAKGPVALVLPGIAYLAYAWFTGRLRRAFPPVMLAGGAVALGISATWFGALWITGRDDVLHEVLVRQNLTRFVEAWDHREPWWYYLAYLWLDMIPWVYWIPLAVADRGRAEGERRLDRLAWALLIAVVAFFSLSESKRSAYVLPAAPAVAVLAAGVAERFLSGRLSRGRERIFRWIGAVTFAGLAVLAVAILGFAAPRYPDLAVPARVLGAVMLGAVLAVGAVAAPYLLAASWLLPAADRMKSVRPFCEKIREIERPGDRVLSYRLSFLRGGYAYYLERVVPNLDDADSLREARGEPGRILLIVEDDAARQAEELLQAEPVLRRKVGSNEAILFVVDPADARAERQRTGG